MAAPTDKQLRELGRRAYEKGVRENKRRCSLCLSTEDMRPDADICENCCAHNLAEFVEDYYDARHICTVCKKRVSPGNYTMTRVQDGQDT